jgi:polyferredoxin
MGIGGCNRLCPAAIGHSLVALFFLSISIKGRPLHEPWLSHRLIIPSTYLLMGAGMLVTLLSEFWLFSDRLIGGGDRWRSKHYIEARPQVWGLRVQV